MTQEIDAGARPIRTLYVVSVLVGLLAAVISVGRLWLADRSAPAEVLWAEDGLFPLCIHKADFFTCLTDPFAGYFLFAPRVLAWPISILPWEHWALATNLLAAALAGVVSGFALLILRQCGLAWFVSIAVALLPALVPMVGLEAINALGSAYMPLLFLATLSVVFPSKRMRTATGNSWIAVSLLLLITALTIPTAIVIAAIVLMVLVRRVVPPRVGFAWIGSTLIGLAAQAWVSLTAASPRPIAFGADTLNAWADAIPVSILTYWPGLSIGTYEFFSNFSLSPVSITGWLFVAALIVSGLWLTFRFTDRLMAVGLLLLAGLGFGLIPSAIGYANNRYFVVPLLLWGAALLVALDPVIRRARWWVVALVILLVLVVWSPAFAASAFRATPAPPWTKETARVEAKCQSDPAFIERPIFTPFWPPNWGDGLTEPTHPDLPCTIAWRWIGE